MEAETHRRGEDRRRGDEQVVEEMRRRRRGRRRDEEQCPIKTITRNERRAEITANRHRSHTP